MTKDTLPFHERSWVEIDLSAFRANLKALKAFLAKDQGFIQIVKADAYGHGAWEISQVALSEGAAALGVANPDEGKLLRIQGCKAPILILSPALPEEIPCIVEYQLIPTLNSADFALSLNSHCIKHNLKCQISLKLDTGMHRSGMQESDLVELWNLCKGLSGLEIVSVFSHYAAAESDIGFSQAQHESFVKLLATHGIKARWIHIANSSALINGLGAETNLCRLGILSYGIYTHSSQMSKISLRPVMAFKSTVAQIKTVSAGQTVGYNLAWKAGRESTLAVITVGYADGYDFLLSDKGKVSINGRICPVVGRVSMDMISVDVTDLKGVKPGDVVTLLGGDDPALRAENLTASYNGSPYELLCQVGRRAKRYYFEEGQVLGSTPLSRRDFVSSDFPDSKLNQIIQSALTQRLASEEIGELISREILRSFFFNKDKDIRYRSNFVHNICLEDSPHNGWFQVKTTLSFTKVLQNDYFLVACAQSDQALMSYFRRKDVEYRWLLDSNFDLSPDAFQLSSVRINSQDLITSMARKPECLEIRCEHPSLKDLVGTEVVFTIDTVTLYPKSSHQLSVFITELTRGVNIGFSYPECIGNVETVPIYSGKNKFPTVKKTGNSISVTINPEEWVFPLSGVVFAY